MTGCEITLFMVYQVKLFVGTFTAWRRTKIPGSYFFRTIALCPFMPKTVKRKKIAARNLKTVIAAKNAQKNTKRVSLIPFSDPLPHAPRFF